MMGKGIVIGIVVASAVLAIIWLMAWSSLLKALNNLVKEDVVEPIPEQASREESMLTIPSDDTREQAIDMIKDRTEILDTFAGN